VREDDRDTAQHHGIDEAFPCGRISWRLHAKCRVQLEVGEPSVITRLHSHISCRELVQFARHLCEGSLFGAAVALRALLHQKLSQVPCKSTSSSSERPQVLGESALSELSWNSIWMPMIDSRIWKLIPNEWLSVRPIFWTSWQHTIQLDIYPVEQAKWMLEFPNVVAGFPSTGIDEEMAGPFFSGPRFLLQKGVKLVERIEEVLVVCTLSFLIRLEGVGGDEEYFCFFDISRPPRGFQKSVVDLARHVKLV